MNVEAERPPFCFRDPCSDMERRYGPEAVIASPHPDLLPEGEGTPAQPGVFWLRPSAALGAVEGGARQAGLSSTQRHCG